MTGPDPLWGTRPGNLLRAYSRGKAARLGESRLKAAGEGCSEKGVLTVHSLDCLSAHTLADSNQKGWEQNPQLSGAGATEEST